MRLIISSTLFSNAVPVMNSNLSACSAIAFVFFERFVLGFLM